VDDVAVAEGDEVIDGLLGALLVGHPDDVDADAAASWQAPPDLDEGDLLAKAGELLSAAGWGDQDDGLASEAQQLLHGLAFVAAGGHRSEDDVVAAALGGSVDRFGEVDLVGLLEREQDPEVPAAGAS
jgi:hypothetical protein